MATATGRALYDFSGDASQGELSFSAGATISILRRNVGDGWSEGQVGGKTGLFPDTYVEEIAGDGGEGEGWDDEDDAGEPDWEDGPDEGGDDDDDEDDKPSHASSAHSSSRVSTYSTTTASDSFGRTETMKRSVNRFSAFVKAGAEAFMMGASVKDLSIDPRDLIQIGDNGGPQWIAKASFGPITVSPPVSKSKFHGIKSYEAYSISGGGAGSVDRRHKHFVWLHERLANKYSCICVPPLPDKQFMSKYGETFLEKRRQKLERWLNRVARHPVLASDMLSFHHFLTNPTADNKAWKSGKRKAESDKLVGAMFFRLVSPEMPCPGDALKSIDAFGGFARNMKRVVDKSMDVSVQHAARMAGAIKSEFKKVSGGFQTLGEVFGEPGDGDSTRLSMGISAVAAAYSEVADMWSEQPRHDQVPWIDVLKEYGAMLNQFNDAVSSSKQASLRVDEVNTSEMAKDSEKAVIKSRADIIHLMTLCEIRHFHAQRRTDFKDALTAYLVSQIGFHEAIVEKLKAAKAKMDQVTYQTN